MSRDLAATKVANGLYLGRTVKFCTTLVVTCNGVLPGKPSSFLAIIPRSRTVKSSPRKTFLPRRSPLVLCRLDLTSNVNGTVASFPSIVVNTASFSDMQVRVSKKVLCRSSLWDVSFPSFCNSCKECCIVAHRRKTSRVLDRQESGGDFYPFPSQTPTASPALKCCSASLYLLFS